MSARDRVIGIVLGVLLGLAVIIAFVFFGSHSTIDAPAVSGHNQPAHRSTSRTLR